MSLKKCKNVHPVSQIPNVLLSFKHLFSVNQLIHVFPIMATLVAIMGKTKCFLLVQIKPGFFPFAFNVF